MKTEVIHISKSPVGWGYNDRYIYIGRRSIYGNPYPISASVDREKSIELFIKYFDERIKEDIEFKQNILKLGGKTLVCFCSPKKCHGDVIVEWLEKNG